MVLFSPRKRRKRTSHDTERVYEISLRTIRSQIVHNTLGAFISGVLLQTLSLMLKAYKKNDTVKRTDKRLENAKH